MVGKLNKILPDLEKFWDLFWRWIGFFPTSVQNFSSKYQEMNFLEGGDSCDLVVSTPARAVITLIAL